MLQKIHKKKITKVKINIKVRSIILVPLQQWKTTDLDHEARL